MMTTIGDALWFLVIRGYVMAFLCGWIAAMSTGIFQNAKQIRENSRQINRNSETIRRQAEARLAERERQS